MTLPVKLINITPTDLNVFSPSDGGAAALFKCTLKKRKKMGSFFYCSRRADSWRGGGGVLVWQTQVFSTIAVNLPERLVPGEVQVTLRGALLRNAL